MRIVIAGGGTGGHLFPGIAIAEEFLKRDDQTRIVFIGTKKGIESKLLGHLGYELKEINEQKTHYDKKLEEITFKDQQLNREKEIELLKSLKEIQTYFHELIEEARKHHISLEDFQSQMLAKFLQLHESTNIGLKRKLFLKNIQIGMMVFVNKLNETGVITSIDKKKSIVTVRIFDKTVKTSFDEVSWVDFRDGIR